MTKAELIKAWQEATGLGEEADEFYMRLMDIMAAELLGGGEVPLAIIGRLKTEDYDEGREIVFAPEVGTEDALKENMTRIDAPVSNYYGTPYVVKTGDKFFLKLDNYDSAGSSEVSKAFYDAWSAEFKLCISKELS